MSLLEYGQGLLAGDLEEEAGPWFARWEGDGDGEGDDDAGAELFFSAVAARAPAGEEEGGEEEEEEEKSVREEWHWDSPPQSPGGGCVDLPYSVLQIVSSACKADVVVVGVMQRRSGGKVLEHLVHVPRGMEVPEVVEVGEGRFVRCGRGAETVGEEVCVPREFEQGLGKRPEAVMARQFLVDGYVGVLYAVWLDRGQVPGSVEKVFDDALLSLPMLLSNRRNARRYETLGKRFDAILKLMQQAVVFVDEDSVQVVVNPAAADLLGLDCHGEVEAGKVAEVMRKLADNSGSSRSQCVQMKEEWILTNPRRVLLVSSYPVSSPAEAAAHGQLWLYQDVTAERDAQEAISAANKGKSRFLAMMSHELRTPMTGVLGMLDLLSLTSLNGHQRELVNIMQDSADGLMQVINNILDYCKMEAGRLFLEDIHFSLTHLFQQLLQLHKDKDRVHLRIIGPSSSTDDASVPVRGDPVRLRQILTNVVGNAVKFSSDGGTVTIAWKFVDLACASRTDTAMASVKVLRTTASFCRMMTVPSEEKQVWLEVQVTDTGEGMSPEQVQCLFSSSHAARLTREGAGAGLGMLICNGLLMLMGGAIRVESELHSGTTVTVVVPLLPGEDLDKVGEESAKASAPPAAVATAADKVTVAAAGNNNRVMKEKEGGGINVLVAEDNRVNQLLIRKLLKQFGQEVEVEVVGNGKLAVEAVQKKCYDLVFMDLQMPVLDGLSATRAIRALQSPTCHIPIYALSADALAPESGPMEETGLDGYLSKPIAWDKMSVVVDAILARKRSQLLAAS